MSRREFIALVCAGITWPVTGLAQKPGRTPRVGYLGTNIGPLSLPLINAFRDGLQQLGYIEGQNIIVEYRWGRGQADELAATQAAELVRLDLDLIVLGATTYFPPLRQASSTIPIVFCASVGDPVSEGIVASLARPGGNTTGISNRAAELDAKALQLLAQAVPSVRRIAVLWDPALPGHKSTMPGVEAMAQHLALELQPVPVKTADEFDTAFPAMVGIGAEAVLVLNSSLMYNNRARLAALALEHRLPSMVEWREIAEAGGLLSYGPDLIPQFRRCAVYVDKILKGATPAELPVEQASSFELVINLKTARALGLTIPDSFLVRADQVIE